MFPGGVVEEMGTLWAAPQPPLRLSVAPKASATYPRPRNTNDQEHGPTRKNGCHGVKKDRRLYTIVKHICVDGNAPKEMKIREINEIR